MDIASMLEVEVQEMPEIDSKENVTPKVSAIQKFPSATYSKEENEFYTLMFGSDIAAVRFNKIHCTGCDEHIGSAPSSSANMHEHPALRTLLCTKCRDFYGDGTFEQGDDATDMFCRWCANGGNLYCCSYCSNTFCIKCIKRNFDNVVVKKIEADERWKCFVCDPRELWSLRSTTRAILQHVQTVTRILRGDITMSAKEVDEKMNLDEAKCCTARKRKRKRRRPSMSNSEDEDETFVPEDIDLPPVKKRRTRKSMISSNVLHNGSDGYGDSADEMKIDHADLADMLIPCEQTMVEGDSPLMDSQGVILASNTTNSPANPASRTARNESPVLVRKDLQKPASKPVPNPMSINPVPIANLLKVVNPSPKPKPRVITQNQQQVNTITVPMTVIPKSAHGTVTQGTLTLIKRPTHFLVQKSALTTVPKKKLPTTPTTPAPSPSGPHNVIDLDSDDEPVIVEKVGGSANSKNMENSPNVVKNPMRRAEKRIENKFEKRGDKNNEAQNDSDVASKDSFEIPQALRHREQRFKRMLMLQSQEIDVTLSNLRRKVTKILDAMNQKQTQLDGINNAALNTRRFHKAMRKSLVDLSQINDKVVKEYVHWKKWIDDEKLPLGTEAQTGIDISDVVMEDCSEVEKENEKEKENENNDGLSLEMSCTRDSASESEDEPEPVTMKPVPLPLEFSHFLDHLMLFKKKVTVHRSTGSNFPITTKDQGVQVYDVPWKDYEKCIGYSLLMKADFDVKLQAEIYRPVAVPNEHFGKYQEQFMFYLQHIEDHGIELDDSKGIPDPNHIPLKDLIDGNSPFIMDILERLSPVMMSNGTCTPFPEDGTPTEVTEADEKMDASEEQENDGKDSDDCSAPTSKAVEELVKMVTKLSEELSSSKHSSENKDVNQVGDDQVPESECLPAKNPSEDNSDGTTNRKEEECTVLD